MNADSVESLHLAIAQGDADAALRIEHKLYVNQVKDVDSEEHYRAEFEKWMDAMRALGQSRAGVPAKGDGVCFFLHAASDLAHVRLMHEVIKQRGETKVIVCSFAGPLENIRFLDVPVFDLNTIDYHARLEVLRSILQREGCGTVVWVSSPLYAAYAFATRLAERQVMWSMRFHPVSSPDIDFYMTQGRRGERTRHFHGQDWTCAHCPVSAEITEVDPIEAERFRLQLGRDIVIGTVAREEKIANQDYLHCVAEILRSLPNAVFLWTGKKERADIRNFFLEMGLQKQHRFMGWVEPNKFVCLLDVFLETFPQGGTMTMVAMAHEVPVVGMNCDSATFGWVENIPKGSGLATTNDEFISLAVGFATDPVRRDMAVAAGKHLYIREKIEAKEDSRKAFRLLSGN